MPLSLDRAAIEAAQLRDVRALLRALATNPFQAARLSGLLAVPPDTLAAFSARAPFTAKQELVDDQAARPPFGSNLTWPLHRYTRFSQTSGTTGRPMRWLDTPESWSWMLDNWTRVFEAAGIAPPARIFFAFSFGPFLGFWTAFEAAARMGCLCIPGGGMPSAARIETIVATAADVLCCTPTYAIHLAAAAPGGALPEECRVRRVVVAGEPGGSIPAVRARIEQAWRGAAVIDHHGMTEVGPVSYQCPARAGVLHVIEPAYYAEVIDPVSGAPAAPGDTGELVLTTLGRVGSPLLRYRTGDLVRLGPREVCACGSSELALEGGIIGRADDMVVVRGVNVHPGAIEQILRASGGVAEYRVWTSEREGLAELRIEVEPEPEAGSSTDDLARRLESALRNALSLRIPVSIAAPGALPRFEMKARRWARAAAK